MSLARGIALFNQGLYWEAHEAWEEEWTRDRRGPDGAFYKGLIQIAAGCLHYTRRNRRGAVNKWLGGSGYLRPYLPHHQGVLLQPLVEQVDGYLQVLSQEGWPAFQLPVIQTLQPG